MVAVAEPWVGVDSSKLPRLARHAGATIGRGGGNFTHPRRPRRGLVEDGKICLPLVCRGGRIARVQLALAADLSENEAMKQEDPAKSRFFYRLPLEHISFFRLICYSVLVKPPVAPSEKDKILR